MGKIGLGICSYFTASLHGCASHQEARLTFHVNRRLPFSVSQIRFLPCCHPLGRCPQSDSQLSINNAQAAKKKKKKERKRKKKREIAALLIAMYIIN